MYLIEYKKIQKFMPIKNHIRLLFSHRQNIKFIDKYNIVELIDNLNIVLEKVKNCKIIEHQDTKYQYYYDIKLNIKIYRLSSYIDAMYHNYSDQILILVDEIPIMCIFNIENGLRIYLKGDSIWIDLHKNMLNFKKKSVIEILKNIIEYVEEKYFIYF